MVIKDLIKKIKSFTSSRWLESTEPFIIEAVTYIDKNKLDIDSLDGQNSLKKYLYENDRAFIWDNMISRDQDAKDIMKEAITLNKWIALRDQISQGFKLEEVEIQGKKQKRIRDKKTGRFVSPKKKGVFKELRS